MNNIANWIAVFFTISCYSFIIKENVLYQFCEHALIGFAAAHFLLVGYENVISMAWLPAINEGQLIWFIPMIAGVALYLQFVKRLSWIARLPLAFLIGAEAAMSLFRALGSQFVSQLASTAKMGLTSVNNVIYVVTVLVGLAYFIISFSERSTLGKGFVRLGKVGQCIMMVGFGATLAGNIGGTLAYLIARMNLIFGDWLGLLK